MAKILKAVIKYVARSGGLRLEGFGDEWFNPIFPMKTLHEEFVRNNDLEGKEVEFTLASEKEGERRFTTIKILGESQSTVPQHTTKKRIENTDQIRRQAALNTATKIIELTGKKTEVEEMIRLTIQVAAELEQWVLDQ